jgi:predicted alpha/beta-hydrolase family hydrolase
MSALVLFPGAGSDRTHAALVAIEEAVLGVREHATVVRADFPYRIAGRRAPDRPPVLLQAVRDQVDVVLAHAPGRVVLGGRSMGGRICSMVAADRESPLPVRVAGLVLVSYPLHPPGRPERLRVEHLPRLTMPCLFVHGTRDPFGSPDELTEWTATIPGPVEHVWIEGGDHELRRAHAQVAAAVAGWVRRRRLLTRSPKASTR